jgi:hypothetical protein
VNQSATGSYAVNSIPGHSTVHLAFGKAYWMEPASIGNSSSKKSQSPTAESTIPVKKYGKNTAVYIPFASSTVITFDLHGKKLNSFFVQEPSWKIFPNSSAKVKMSVVQIISNSGRKLSFTVK